MLQDAFQSQHRTKLYSGQCGRYSGKLSSPASLPVYSSQGVSYPVTAQSGRGWSAENCPGPPGPPWVEAEVVEDLLVVRLPCPCSLHALISPPSPLPSLPWLCPLLRSPRHSSALSAFFLGLCFEVCLSWTALAPGGSSAHPFLSFRISLSHLWAPHHVSPWQPLTLFSFLFLGIFSSLPPVCWSVSLSPSEQLSVLYIAGLPVLRGEPGTVCRLCECRCPVEWVGWFAHGLGLWLWSSRWAAERRSQGHGVS